MSDLGSEELEEEGENDLGVRAPVREGLPGVRSGRTPSGRVRRTQRTEASCSPPPTQRPAPARAGPASWKSVVTGETL